MVETLRAALVLAALLLVPVQYDVAAAVLEGHVVWVDDGDTIDVQIGDRVERVRYIGVDAPEIGHHGVGGAPGGLAAARVNAALVGGQRVRLELDRELRDRYGRLLAYVWIGERLINAELLRAGYARALVIPPNLRYARLFRALEREARAARRGLWAGAGSFLQGEAIEHDGGSSACLRRSAHARIIRGHPWRLRTTSAWMPSIARKRGSSSSPASRRWSAFLSISTAPINAGGSTPRR